MTDLFATLEQGPPWLIVARYISLLIATLGFFTLWAIFKERL